MHANAHASQQLEKKELGDERVILFYKCACIAIYLYVCVCVSTDERVKSVRIYMCRECACVYAWCMCVGGEGESVEK